MATRTIAGPGEVDPTFDPGSGGGFSGATANKYVHAVALQSGGKIIVGGDFTAIAGAARNRIARLHTNGSLDMNFDPASGVETLVGLVSNGNAAGVALGINFRTYIPETLEFLTDVMDRVESGEFEAPLVPGCQRPA